MKVYVYGRYVRGIHNHRRIREYEGITTHKLIAFIECYTTGLDGNDYFLIEYDPTTFEKKQIIISDSEHWEVMNKAKRHVEYVNHAGSSKLEGMRADEV